MTEQAYVFDTYALLEIIDGNKNYEGYTRSKIIITEFILAELRFNLIRKSGKEFALRWIDKLAKFVVPTDKTVINEAMEYRFNNLRKDLSMTDCIGYFLAKSLGIKFLTGDKEFKNLQNVEFVK